MSIFGNSRAVQVICQKKMPSENWFFLDEGVMGLRQGVGGGFKVGRYLDYMVVPFWGGCNTLVASARGIEHKSSGFFDTFVAA